VHIVITGTSEFPQIKITQNGISQGAVLPRFQNDALFVKVK